MRRVSNTLRAFFPSRGIGQGIVEFALALPIFTIVVMVTIQFGLLFVWYYSETRMARETARWLAVRRDTTDDLVAAHVQSTMLPGFIGGTPSLSQTGTLPSPNPNDPNGSYLDTIYTVGSMTVAFPPCIPSSGVCTHPRRASGEMLYVQMSYDASNIIFLPTTFRIGTLAVGIPTSLPAHKVWVMAE